jgi:hypothetical protein
LPDNTNTMDTAARFRERAAECVKLAAVSIDPNVEAKYRTLAERYAKLAECEEYAKLADCEEEVSPLTNWAS